MDNIFSIQGMHCASCATIIEKTLKKNNAIKNVSVNYASETALIDFDKEATNLKKLSATLEPFGYSLIENNINNTTSNQSLVKQEKLKELNNTKTILKMTIPIAIISILIMSWDISAALKLIPAMSDVWENFFHHLLPILATFIFVIAGRPYIMGLYRFLRYGKANMDTLIGLGTSAAFIYSFIVTSFEDVLSPYLNTQFTYYDVTIVVIVFISLGKYLEMRSKLKTGDAIEKLLNLQAKTAIVIRDGQEIEVALEEVLRNDLIVVKPGGKIPVDGIITEGSPYIDESMITGEALAINKNLNDSVAAGTINTTTAFIFKATKIGQETMLAHIINMVEEAQSSKAPIQALADKISGIFVPIVLLISILTLSSWLIFGPSYIGFSQSLSFGLMSFVGILVIACPCALGLATPTAIIVGVGKGARAGILIKDATSLQTLHKVNVLVFDKTGTITKGQPEIISLNNYSELSDNEIINIVASLEKKSEHPIGAAIVKSASAKNIQLTKSNNVEIFKGLGLKGEINNQLYFVGSPKFIKEKNLNFDEAIIFKKTSEGKTPIILADTEKVLAIIFVADDIKLESKAALKELGRLKIKTIMLTGDNKQTAEYIAKLVGIDEVVASAMPEDKINKIKYLQAEGKIVAMVGDGINDAPALAQANIGIAMATGTDVAIESAGITLLHGDISKLVKAIHLSKSTMTTIKQNLFWAFIYNVVGIPVAGGLLYPFFGILLNPIFAGLAMALSSVSVVSNSLRLKTKKL